jgi:hypothetical protein
VNSRPRIRGTWSDRPEETAVGSTVNDVTCEARPGLTNRWSSSERFHVGMWPQAGPPVHGGGDGKVLGGKLQSVYKAEITVKQGRILEWTKSPEAYWMKPDIAAAVLALLGDEAD